MLPGTRPFAWVALLVDYGTLAFLLALPRMADELWSTSRFNLLEEFAGRRDNRRVCLRLFRRGVFTLEYEIHRPPGEFGLTRAGTIGSWKREQSRLLLDRGGDSAVFDTVADGEHETLLQVTGFCANEQAELALTGIELRLMYRRAARPGN